MLTGLAAVFGSSPSGGASQLTRNTLRGGENAYSRHPRGRSEQMSVMSVTPFDCSPVGVTSRYRSLTPKKAKEKRTLVISPVTVEKVHFSQNGQNFGDRKCPRKPRSSFVGPLTQSFFERFPESEFFNSHEILRQVLIGRNSRHDNVTKWVHLPHLLHREKRWGTRITCSP